MPDLLKCFALLRRTRPPMSRRTTPRFTHLPNPLEVQRGDGRKDRPNQALQTTPMTRSAYERTIEFGIAATIAQAVPVYLN